MDRSAVDPGVEAAVECVTPRSPRRNTVATVVVRILVATVGLGWMAAVAVAHSGATAESASGGPPTWGVLALGLVAASALSAGFARYSSGDGGRRLGHIAAAGFVLASVAVVGVGATGTAPVIVDALGDSTVDPLWVSDTGRDIGGNHHAAAVADGTVYAPVSGPGTPAGCELVALHGADGGTVWTAPVAPANCTIHAVADPAVADYDDDGIDEVLVATTERELVAYTLDGRVEHRLALSDYGYTRPVVADLSTAEGPETVVVDATGTVVVASEGDEQWRHRLDDYVWARPLATDVDGDGDGEVLVASRDGRVTLLAADGTVEWETTLPDSPDSSWLAAGQADDDPALELVVATVDGGVYALDGAEGERLWTFDAGSLAAVGGFDDGDGDGDAEVYVTDNSGTVRALDAASGAVEWETQVTAGPVQMMPPPSLGDVDDDDTMDLVVPAHDGSVSLVDPATGEVVASYDREGRIFARATLDDVDGDADDDAVVVYADGTVVALDF